jgi:hypothetical protein
MNKLLKYILVILFLSVGCMASAQVIVRTYPRVRRYPPPPQYNNNQYNNRPTGPENRVEAIKERFIAQQLQLSPQQSRIFFPLYHEYQQELSNIRKLKRLNNMNTTNGADQVNRDMYYETEILNVKRKFNDAFMRIMPPEKVSQLYKCERAFNDELVHQLSERNGRPLN